MLLSPDTMVMEGRRSNAIGSLFIVQAKTIEEARKVIESDLYYTSGVVSYMIAINTYIQLIS
jgi:uncharacterized protein YciI